MTLALPRVLRPLAHRDFALLWSGQTLSVVGNFVNYVALPWQVLLLTGSAVQLGAVMGITAASGLVFSLFGGAVTDRLPRRRVLLATDLVNGLVFGSVAVLSASGALRVEHLYAAAAVSGAAFSFFYPAIQAIIPEVVPAEVLVQGNVLRGFSRQAGQLVGPALGGVIVAAAGPAPAFAFDSLTFFVSFAVLVAVRAAPAAARGGASILADIVDGLRFTFSVPWLWITIFLFAFVNAAYVAAWAVGLPVLVRDVLRADATVFGAVSAAIGLGQVAGGILLGQVRVRRAGLFMYASTVLFGLAVSAVGAFPALPTLLVAATVIGVSIVSFEVPWVSLLQTLVPRELLGRVSSVDLFFGAMLLGPVSPLVGGVLVASFGPAPVFLWAGAAIAAMCAMALLVPSIRRLEQASSM